VSPQGKKGNPAAAARAKQAPPPRPRKTLGLVIFGVLFIALFVFAAAAIGIGKPAVPDDAIAVVEDAPDGTITKEQFEQALVQTASSQGLEEVPPEDDPQYELLKQSAESDLILGRWVAGEAQERGIEVTDTELQDELETIKEQQFGSDKAFEKFVRDSGFCTEEELASEPLDCAAVTTRIELGLLSDRIQEAVLPADQEPEVTDDEIQEYYDANLAQFEQPETRDVRVILTKTPEEADEALAALGTDPSSKTWDEVAKKFSIDEATKSTGGLREAVVAGQSEPALDDAIFASPEGELVGPVEGDAGAYVIQVESITPGETRGLDDEVQPAAGGAPAQTVSDQIRATLVAARQQEVAQAFQDSFQTKWTARTICADDFRIDRCSNAEPPPNPCTEEIAETQGCDAPVPSTRPIAPGTNTVFGGPAPVGLPQGPQTPAPAGAEGAVPGLTPVPGGAAPPGGAVPPTGAAPPAGAPPGTVPPG
jgi:foldase protein PrsA